MGDWDYPLSRNPGQEKTAWERRCVVAFEPHEPGAAARREPGIIADYRFRSRTDLIMPAAKSPPASFETAMAELEALVEKMDSGQLPLEESLGAYQRGVELLKYCEKLLADAQQRVRVLEDGALKDLPSDDVN
jgi:exodeoxyribonuclease VII small subunit